MSSEENYLTDEMKEKYELKDEDQKAVAVNTVDSNEVQQV